MACVGGREKMYAAVFNGAAIGVHEKKANAWFQNRCGGVQLVESMPFRILRCCSGGSWRKIEKKKNRTETASMKGLAQYRDK